MITIANMNCELASLIKRLKMGSLNTHLMLIFRLFAKDFYYYIQTANNGRHKKRSMTNVVQHKRSSDHS